MTSSLFSSPVSSCQPTASLAASLASPARLPWTFASFRCGCQ